MNRKKISLLLTGLMITSSLFTGCKSSNENKTKSENNSKVAQEESYLKRASERTVRELNPDSMEQYPNVAYADDAIDNSTGKDVNNKINPLPNENQFNNSNNLDNGTARNNLPNEINENLFDKSTTDNNNTSQLTNPNTVNPTTPDTVNPTTPNTVNPTTPNTMNPSVNDNRITDSNNDINNFQNPSTQNQVNGFSNVIDEDLELGNNNSNIVNKPNSQMKQATEENLNTNDNLLTPSQNETNMDTFDIKNDQNETMAPNNPQVYSAPRAAAESTEAGRIEVVRAVGKSQLGVSRYQGIVELSFKLSGEVIQREGLAQVMQEAYEEARKDANMDYAGTTTTKREELITKLQTVFGASTDKIELLFESPQGIQSFRFKAKEMFPNLPANTKGIEDYKKKVIDLDYTDNTYSIMNRSVNRNPEDIVMKMLIRVGGPKESYGLYTNTNYKFLGTKDNKNLLVTDTGTTKRDQIVGFTIPDFKTGKQPASLEAKVQTNSSSILYDPSDPAYKQEAKGLEKAYFDVLKNNVYINMKKLITDTPTRSIEPTRERSGRSMRSVPVTTSTNLEISGTSIKFKNIIFRDEDKTISNIKLEDYAGEKYNAQLIPVDTNDKSKGSYVEVTGLKRDTPYTFTKMLVTSNFNNKEETKTVYFSSKDDGQKVILNDIPIRTTTFEGPELQKTTNTTVTLPGGLTVPQVKNDSTSLRYILQTNNTEGLVGNVRVNGLRGNEQSKVEKIEDKDKKINYYVVTLFNLTPQTDYGFVILETEYTDPNGNSSVSRQAIRDINVDTTADTNDITDNMTEAKALTGTAMFNVIVNDEIKSENAREIEVPVFVDDMQDKFIRADFSSPKDNPDVVFKFEDNKLKFSNLKPESNSVYKVEFVYKNENNEEGKIAKYIKINTPKASDLDIRSSSVIPSTTSAKVTFDLFNEPKSQIKSVDVKDANEKTITSTWDNSTKTLTLDNLSQRTEYKNLKATFTLDNNKKITHNLSTFTTEEEEVKPTGKVAEFVSRVYTIALNREPEVQGWSYWITKLTNKEISATEFIAENLMTQPEFVERELSKKNFVRTMYSLIVNREPDEDGQSYWERKYDEYRLQVSDIEGLRIKIAREMMNESEFKKLVTDLGLAY